jgi:hypothetical protein
VWHISYLYRNPALRGGPRYTGSMFKMLFAISALAVSVLGQAQNGTANEGKVDKAAAYNFYTVAHTYAIKATNAHERNQGFIDKAIENYRAAIKADPEASLAITELAEITRTGHLRIQLHPLLAPNR